MPPPVPPSVNEGRITMGSPICFWYSTASSIECTICPRAVSTPIFFMAAWNSSRSSPFLIAAAFAPISSTPNSSSVPFAFRSMARFRAVWPPRVGSSASGRSFSMTRRTNSGVRGSRYVASARSGSVMIVAGLLFTSTTR